MPEVRRVGVLGCGLMGSGIAEISAKSGLETWVREVNDQLSEKGKASITKSLDKAVEKGKLDKAPKVSIKQSKKENWIRLRATQRSASSSSRRRSKP
jgi:3-hydroxyacyl-CoA dehydrogenase